MFNTLFFLAVSLLVGGLVLSNRVKDGIIVKLGLILVSVGFFGASAMCNEGFTDLMPALHFIGIGVGVCAGGVVYRGWTTGWKIKRREDWLAS